MAGIDEVMQKLAGRQRKRWGNGHPGKLWIDERDFIVTLMKARGVRPIYGAKRRYEALLEAEDCDDPLVAPADIVAKARTIAEQYKLPYGRYVNHLEQFLIWGQQYPDMENPRATIRVQVVAVATWGATSHLGGLALGDDPVTIDIPASAMKTGKDGFRAQWAELGETLWARIRPAWKQKGAEKGVLDALVGTRYNKQPLLDYAHTSKRMPDASVTANALRKSVRKLELRLGLKLSRR